MGDKIRSYSVIAERRDDSVADILHYLNEVGIKCPPVLLKNAETANRAWKKECEFLDDVKDVSYGKLKAILPVIDPDFISQTKIPDAERKRLIENLNEITYKEVLKRVKELRHVYDPSSLSVDVDQFYSDLHSINEYLESAITKHDNTALASFRSKYSQRLIYDTRLLIATIRSEDTFEKQQKNLPGDFKGLPSVNSDFDESFSNIARALIALRRGNPNSRERVRRRIGVSKLGELSTLLKAASSDEELQRYMRGQELLKKIKDSAFRT